MFFTVGFFVGLVVFLGLLLFITLTVHMYFFLPIFACTFAVPFFIPLTFIPVLVPLEIFTNFFPLITYHLTINLFFLRVILAVFPFFTLIFFVILTFDAALELFTLQSVNDNTKTTVRYFFNFLFILFTSFLDYFSTSTQLYYPSTTLCVIRNIIFNLSNFCTEIFNTTFNKMFYPHHTTPLLSYVL